MEGRGGRCRLLWLRSFSLSLRLLLPHLRPTWQSKIPTTDGRWRKCCRTPTKKKTHTSTHGCSGFVVLRERNTHTHTHTRGSYVNHVTADTQGALVPVSGASGCLWDLWNVVCVYMEWLHKQRESGQQRHTWTLLHLVNADALDTGRFVLFLVCAAENGRFLLWAILKCCDAQNLGSGVI